ncbi:hypothetical protein QE152_g13876 [Popillia japonica]|uniref:Secreted protein n=1 Tax=Popillia japonica TaxID=7064 RepID=A0AAW1LB99_POPJA
MAPFVTLYCFVIVTDELLGDEAAESDEAGERRHLGLGITFCNVCASGRVPWMPPLKEWIGQLVSTSSSVCAGGNVKCLGCGPCSSG